MLVLKVVAVFGLVNSAAHADVPKGFAPTPKLKPRPWPTDEKNRALAGAWVVKRGGKAVAAWQVDPGQVTSYDGSAPTSHANPAVTTAPCAFEIITVNVVGKDHARFDSTTYHFARIGDEIRIGGGAAAIRTPTGAIVCAQLGTYVLDGARCMAYAQDNFDKEVAAPREATCAIDGTKLTIPTEEALTFTGESATNPQLEETNTLVRAKSFAAARAEVDAAKKSKP